MPQFDLLTIGDSAIDMYMKIGIDSVSSIPAPQSQSLVGSSNPDSIGNLSQDSGLSKLCFIHGTKIIVDEMATAIAGNAVNVASGCNKCGLHTMIYTELGDDANASRIIKELKEDGINTNFCVKNSNSPTNVHAVIIHGGERTIFSYHEPRDYKLMDWSKPKWLFYSSLAKGFETFQKELVKYLKLNTNIGVAVNPGTIQIKSGLDGLRNILEVTDVLFVNKEEAALLVGEHPLETTHIKLQNLGPKLTVITNGILGSSVFDRTELHKIGIFDDGKPVVDKTGAGDAYASGFLSALFYNKPLLEAMKWGAINSAGVLQAVGGRQGLRSKRSLEQYTRDFDQYHRI